MSEGEASQIGRPTDYEEGYPEQAEKLCALGATDMELADFFGVHVATIYRWKHTYEDFCEAIKAGKDKSDERVVRSLYQRATGYDFTETQGMKVKDQQAPGQFTERVETYEVQKHQPADTTAAIFWLKNRRPDEWRDKQEHVHSGLKVVLESDATKL